MAIPEAYWVLNDKVNLPESQIGSLDEVLVPGGERWAGIGVENGDLAFSNARELRHESGPLSVGPIILVRIPTTVDKGKKLRRRRRSWSGSVGVGLGLGFGFGFVTSRSK